MYEVGKGLFLIEFLDADMLKKRVSISIFTHGIHKKIIAFSLVTNVHLILMVSFETNSQFITTKLLT
jgi:hypothetical protein